MDLQSKTPLSKPAFPVLTLSIFFKENGARYPLPASLELATIGLPQVRAISCRLDRHHFEVLRLRD